MPPLPYLLLLLRSRDRRGRIVRVAFVCMEQLWATLAVYPPSTSNKKFHFKERELHARGNKNPVLLITQRLTHSHQTIKDRREAFSHHQDQDEATTASHD